MVRKTPVALIAIAALGLTLAGCSASGQTSESANTTRVTTGECESRSDASTPALDAVTVSDPTAQSLTVDAPAPLMIHSSQHKVLEAGDGPTILSTDQGIRLRIWQSPDGVSNTFTPWQFDEQLLTASQLGQQIPALPAQLLCAREGDRLSVAIDAEGLGATTASPGQGMLFFVDVLKVIPTAATGHDVFNADFGLPAVIRDTVGRPGVVVPTGHAPQTTKVQTLLQGDGAKIDASTTFYAHILSVGWDNRSEIDNTWNIGSPRAVTTADFPSAVAKALEGKQVGSQVMVVVPVSEITPDERSGTTLPSEGAVIYVIDILATQ